MLKTVGHVLFSLVLGLLAGFYLLLPLIIIIFLICLMLIVAVPQQKDAALDSKENDLSFMIGLVTIFIIGMAIGMGLERFTELGSLIGSSGSSMYFLR